MKSFHFWYSERQKQIGLKLSPQHGLNLVTINGDKLAYTEVTTYPMPGGNWDDYVYLGSIPESGFWDAVEITHQK